MNWKFYFNYRLVFLKALLLLLINVIPAKVNKRLFSEHQCFNLNYNAIISKDVVSKIDNRYINYNVLGDSCGDKIVLKDSSVIIAHVTEIEEKTIGYKLCQGNIHTRYTVSKADVCYIKFQNGVVEYFIEKTKKGSRDLNQNSDIKKQYYISFNCFPGWINRARIRWEVKYPNRNALLHSLTYFYGEENLGPMYHFEYRRINKALKAFFYSKAGTGFTHGEYQKAAFVVGGLGFGQRNYSKNKRFLMEFTQGVQIPYVYYGKIRLNGFFPPEFYIAGPGSYLNFNINLVWRIK